MANGSNLKNGEWRIHVPHIVMKKRGEEERGEIEVKN